MAYKLTIDSLLRQRDELAKFIKEWEECVLRIHERHARGIVHIPSTKLEPFPFPTTKVLELDMEKRGVVLDDDKTKTAGVEKRCPSCGAELTDPTHCPVCGTKPFEKRRDDASEEESGR